MLSSVLLFISVLVNLIRNGRFYYERLYIILIGAFLLAIFFYLIEVKLIPYRTKKILQKLIKETNGILLTENFVCFEISKRKIYVKLMIEISVLAHAYYSEKIIVCVERKKNETLLNENLERNFKKRMLDDIELFEILTLRSNQIKKLKRKIEEKLLTI